MGGIYLLKDLTIGDLLELSGYSGEFVLDSDRGILKKIRKSTGHLSVNVIVLK